MRYRVLVALVAVLLFPAKSFCQDFGELIVGSRVDGATTGTSMTTLLYGFWSGYSRSPRPSWLAVPTSWTVTRIQTYADATTKSLHRVSIPHYLRITNLTTYTLCITPNTLNETTPTAATSIATAPYVLWPAGTGYPFMLELNSTTEPDIFPIGNVIIYAYYADLAAAAAEISSATVCVWGH